MRRAIIATAAVVALAAPALPAQAGPVPSRAQGKSTEYVVLYSSTAQAASARTAVRDAGGTIVKENKDIGLATVRTTNTAFSADARRSSAVQGVAHNRAVGYAPKDRRQAPKSDAVEKDVRGTPSATPTKAGAKAEPLAGRQWDLRQMGVLDDAGKYRVRADGAGVRVGIIDTGVDGDHPDIKANFDREDSRNFTTDIPSDAEGTEVDGPCEYASCVDPADEDDNEHGTHVASEIASPRNGFGMSGIAPKAKIVNVRAGQDSGYFFLQPTVDALTYSGRIGLDVVNMSFYVDPWQWNCADNPADSAEARQEQVTVVAAVQRALAFAHDRGVTMIAAAGNYASDYTKPILDNTSPDFVDVPGKKPYDRTVDPATCLSMPSQGKDVLPIASTGISKRTSYFSDYGKGYIAVAAPGGDSYDTADGKADPTKAILAAYPEALAKAAGVLNPDGSPNTPGVVRDCKGGTCAYYQYLQGTSMASPHAVGLAALIIGKYGKHTRDGLTMNPDQVKKILLGTATPTACPPGGTYTYTRYVKQADGSYQKVVSTKTCEGTKQYNGFYGNGIINAERAVGR